MLKALEWTMELAQWAVFFWACGCVCTTVSKHGLRCSVIEIDKMAVEANQILEQMYLEKAYEVGALGYVDTQQEFLTWAEDARKRAQYWNGIRN